MAKTKKSTSKKATPRKFSTKKSPPASLGVALDTLKRKLAPKKAAPPRRTHGDVNVTVTLTPPQCGCEHDYEVSATITSPGEPEVTWKAPENCHPGSDAEFDIDTVTCEGNEVAWDDLTSSMQDTINSKVAEAIAEKESEPDEEDPDDKRDRLRDDARDDD